MIILEKGFLLKLNGWHRLRDDKLHLLKVRRLRLHASTGEGAASTLGWRTKMSLAGGSPHPPIVIK